MLKNIIHKRSGSKWPFLIGYFETYSHWSKFVKNSHFRSEIKAQLEAKIKTLEDAFDRDKENRQDYLEIQHRRKLKVKDQEINSLKEELKTNKEQI